MKFVAVITKKESKYSFNFSSITNVSFIAPSKVLKETELQVRVPNNDLRCRNTGLQVV